MQYPPVSSTAATGELIAIFRHGKIFLLFTLIIGLLFLGLAGIVLYLSTWLSSNEIGLIDQDDISHVSSQSLVAYSTSIFFALVAVILFSVFLRQQKLRQDSYHVYQYGIMHIKGAHQQFTPFAEIEELYVASSGQSALGGFTTHFAYRRNANEPFHRVIESLQDFQYFQQLVRELQVRERLPIVLETVIAGGSVSFKYIVPGKAWSKRISNKTQAVTTKPLLVSQNFLEIEGHQVAIARLSDDELKAWKQQVVINGRADRALLSIEAAGILSHDLFLNTLLTLRGAKNNVS